MFLLPWLLCCLTVGASAGQNAAHKSPIPEYLSDWITLSPPQEKSDAMDTAIHSDYDWEVGMQNGRPVAHRRDPKTEEASALPKPLRHADGKPDEQGDVHAVQVSNGWLVDYDEGEWGASLWWYAADGKQRYKISNDPIVQFLPTQKGMYALAGLTHGVYNAGRIVQLRQDSAGKWTSARFVSLGHAPRVGTADAEGNFLVSTTDELVLIHPDKSEKMLLSPVFWRWLDPHSIALSPNGDIYLGMRHGVTRVLPFHGTYVAEWLLPNQEFVQAKPKK